MGYVTFFLYSRTRLSIHLFLYSRGRVAWAEGFLWGRPEDVIQEKNREGYVMIRDRPKGCVYGTGSDIILNVLDIRSKFRCTTLGEIASRNCS